MGNKSLSTANIFKALRFPLNIFLATIFISLSLIGAVAYSFFLGDKMCASSYPLVDAIMEVKIEVTTAHLWFEEIVSGDRNEKISDVIRHIDNATLYTNTMLKGGESPAGLYVPIAQAEIQNNLEDLLTHIAIFKAATIERYETINQSGVGTPVDQKYDDCFTDLLGHANSAERKLMATIASDLTQFRYLQSLLLFSLIVSVVILLLIFYRYEKQREKVLSGLIPICSSCKKIRDDKGYWNRIESYISDRTHAVFTHSYCQSCIRELYPDIADEVIAEIES